MKTRSLVVSDLRSETKGFRFEFVLLAMRRGESSAVIARLLSKVFVKRVEVVERS